MRRSGSGKCSSGIQLLGDKKVLCLVWVLHISGHRCSVGYPWFHFFGDLHIITEHPEKGIFMMKGSLGPSY